MDNNILASLQTPRPSRGSIRAKQLGIDQGPNKLGAVPQVSQSQLQVTFGYNSTHLLLMLVNGQNQTVIPMDQAQWDEFVAAGNEAMALVGTKQAEPEPAAVYDDDEAVIIRQRIEDCAVAYGKFYATNELCHQAFRHRKHAENWAQKHKLTVELGEDGTGVTFYPAVVDQERLSEGTVHVGSSSD